MPDKININSTELLVDFKTAKDKREQINILADLHCCAPRTIAELLKQLGALDGTDLTPTQFLNRYVPAPAAPGRRLGGRPLGFDEDVARRLFAEGVSTRDVAKALGVSHTAIQNWAKRRGLKREPPNSGPKAKKEKTMGKKSNHDITAELAEEDTAKIADGERREPCEPRPAAKITMEPRPEPPRRETPEEPRPLSLGELRRYLTGFLPAVLNEAQLYIDGSPVTEFYGFSVTSPNGVPTVDLLTRRGA